MIYEIYKELSLVETHMLKDNSLQFIQHKWTPRISNFVESVRSAGIIADGSPVRTFWALRKNITVAVREWHSDTVRHLTAYAVTTKDVPIPKPNGGMYVIFAIAEYNYKDLEKYYQIRF